MEKVLLEVGQHFTTNGGDTVFCYDTTEKFAFMAPVEITETEVKVLIEKTLVYTREVEGDELSPIQTISFDKDMVEKAE